MSLKQAAELHAFLSTYFPDADPGSDEETVRAFAASAPADRRLKIVSQARALIAGAPFPLEELGIEANRWFGDEDEARGWLGGLLGLLEGGPAADGAPAVKDSNGTPLSEGDSVTVIKDLKVKGGSSDLKRGTTIRKIHLVDDPEVVECRVDGSTLVLKTCFLKKA